MSDNLPDDKTQAPSFTGIFRHPQHKPELRARIVALFEAGKTRREIAAELGVTKNSVIGHLLRAGLSTPIPAVRMPLPPQVDMFPPPAHCQFITGDEPAAWVFCGDPVEREGEAWCSAHRRRVYVGKLAKDAP